MLPIHAYALSGAIVASATAWGFLQFPGLLIWCAFIGWAGFLHSGGDRKILPSTICSLVFGAFMAWCFSLIVASKSISLPLPVVAAVVVAVFAPAMILASKISIFNIIPATFYGFATSFAYLAQTPGRFSMGAMTSVNLENVIIVVPISLIVGTLLGLTQVQFANRLMIATTQSG